MSVHPPLLPAVELPVGADTRHGQRCLRPLVPGEPRVDSASEYDDWA